MLYRQACAFYSVLELCYVSHLNLLFACTLNWELIAPSTVVKTELGLEKICLKRELAIINSHLLHHANGFEVISMKRSTSVPTTQLQQLSL